MHPPGVKRAALELIGAGVNDCEISRRLGIPRSTIKDWRRPTYVSQKEYAAEACWRCWGAGKPVRLTSEDYAELLGFYLGDGCISEHARTCRLRIALDAKYPKIIADCTALLERVFPRNPVGRVEVHGGTMYYVSVYSSHLPCLLPQHGRGPKHRRRIVLEDWQRAHLEAAPWAFVRACIWTDGCAFINRTGPYEYLSYDFSNMSKDIIELFSDACRRVGVFTRTTCEPTRDYWHVRINRRESVALMKAHVGLKT